MRKKQYGIMILILVLILAAFGILRGVKSHQEKVAQEEEEAQTVYAVSFDSSDVTAFSYQYSSDEQSEQELNFEKSDDAWTYTSDTTIDLDEDQIDTMLSTLSSITANSTIESVSDVSQYGLDTPVQQVNIQFTDGAQTTLVFGMENEVLGGYYLQVSGDENVYLVDSTYMTSTLNKSVEDLTAEEETDDTESSDDSDTTVSE
jgi:type II secretory pathway pseudopilin PulG